MKYLNLTLLAAGWLGILPLSLGGADPAQGAARDAALKRLVQYRIGSSTNGLSEIVQWVREVDQDPVERRVLEGRMIRFLQSRATVDAKRFVCRQLALIGSAESVPVLARFLGDETMANMARYALELIPGPEVDAALLSRLSDVGTPFQIGIINSLGQRKSAPAVAVLVESLSDPNQEEAITRAVLGALKKIGGPEAASGLSGFLNEAAPSLRPLVADALLWVADDLWQDGMPAEAEVMYRICHGPDLPVAVRAGALRGLLRVGGSANLQLWWKILAEPDAPLLGVAADLLRRLPEPSLVALVTARLGELPPEAQVLILGALRDRGDAAAMPAIEGAAQSGRPEVSVAALEAAGALGGTKSVLWLAAVLGDANPDKRVAAAEALSRLRGPGVDEELLALLPKQSVEIRKEIIHCLVQRTAEAATPALIRLAGDAGTEPAVRASAWEALGSLAGPEEFGSLATLVSVLPEGRDLQAAESALKSCLMRAEAKEALAQEVLQSYGKASAPVRCVLLRVAGQAGGEAALEQTRLALRDRQPGVWETAARVLSDWPTPEPAADLLDLVRATLEAGLRAVAFRGYVRMAGLTAAESKEAALGMYKNALGLSAQPAELKLVLSGLGQLAWPGALDVARAYLRQPPVSTEAGVATIKIAGALAKTHPDLARSALEDVLQHCQDAGIRQQAQGALKRVP